MNRCLMQNDTRRALFGTLNDHDLRDRWQRLAIASSVLGRIIASYTEVSEGEAIAIIRHFDARKALAVAMASLGHVTHWTLAYDEGLTDREIAGVFTYIERRFL